MLRKLVMPIAFMMILAVLSSNAFGQQISVLPDSLMAVAGTGDTTFRSLVVKNTGTDTLRWEIKIQSGSVGAQPTGAVMKSSPLLRSSTAQSYQKKSGRGSDGPTLFKSPITSKSTISSPLRLAMPAQTPPKVAVLIGACDNATDAINTLVSTGMFTAGDFTVFADPSALQLSDLTPYEAVLAWTNCAFTNSQMVGDVLKQYVDAGGGVVMATYAFSNSWSMTGGILDPYYAPFLPAAEQNVTGTMDMNSITEPGHPIFNNILSAPVYTFNSNYSNPPLNTGGILLAKDTGGNNLVAVNESGKCVGLVIFPENLSSSNAETSLLFANALYFVASPSWVVASSKEGAIAPGDSTALTITLNAANLSAGTYYAEIHISSNDILDTLVVVPVQLHVTPATIDMSVSELSLDVKAVDSVLTAVSIGNTGTGYLKWSASVSVSEGEAPEIKLVNDKGSVKAGSSQNLAIKALAGNLSFGTYYYTITISSNDTATPAKYISLDVTVLPPVFSASPDTFTSTIGAGDSIKHTLNIQNTGDGNLKWNITVSKTPPLRGQKTFVNPVLKERTLSTQVTAGSKAPHARNIISANPAIARLSEQIAASPDQSILIIQNASAWGIIISDFIQQNFGNIPVVINSSAIANTDFTPFDLIITAGDQDDGVYYNAISANVAKFEDYVSGGGVVQYQLATQGENVDIVGGVTVTYGNSDSWNRILLPDHPIVAGLTSPLEGSSANHCYLTNLPQDAEIITETWNSLSPTTAEYTYGAGRVIATGMTWEYLYYNAFNSGPMMGKAVEYSLSVSTGNWLSSNPKNGIVTPASNQNVSVKMDASKLLPGDYEAYLLVHSNDPENSLKVVTAQLSVLPAVLSLSTDSLSMTIASVDSAVTSFNIGNTGAGFIRWSAVAKGELAPYVRFSPGKGSAGTGTPQTVEVKVLPVDVPGDYSFAIELSTNDTSRRKVTIPVSVKILAPQVSVAPDSFEVTVETGDSTSRTLTINNTGNGNLKWDIYIQDVTENLSKIGTGDASSQTTGSAVTREQTALRRPNRPSKNMMLNKAAMFEELRRAQAAAIPGDFTFKASSPVPVTCVTVDPRTNIIYAQENSGYGFYKYDPKTDQWTDLTSCPLYSGNNGGAVYWDGKIYTTYTGEDSLGIYDIAGNSWSTAWNNVPTGNIEAVGGYLYLAGDFDFQRFNTSTAAWDTLQSPGELFGNFDGENTWGGLKYYNGYLYNLNGNGDTAFAKYNLNSKEWTLLPGLPDGAVLGSAIDPVTHKLFAYGDYDGTNWYAFDLINETWSVTTLDMFTIGGGGDRAMSEEWGYLDDGGMAYVASGPTVGVYFTEGEGGTGLAVFETPRALSWLRPETTSGVVQHGGSQSLNLKIYADTLSVGDYRAIISLSSNDTGKMVVDIPVTLKVRSDAKGPRISLHFFQDNYLTQYLDVVATMNEPLGSAAVIEVTKPDNSTEDLTIDTVDLANNVYYSHFRLDQAGTFTFKTTATDTAGNTADTSRSLSAALGKANAMLKLTSSDASATLSIGENNLKTDAVITVAQTNAPVVLSEEARSVSDRYTFGPDRVELASAVTVTFDYSKMRNADDEHLVIYSKTKDGFVPLKSTINRNARTVSASVDKLGEFQLFHNSAIRSDEETLIPKQFSLYQNYPNPFNPSTTIRFDLPAGGKVTIAVYNILGQKVRTLADRSYEAGSYTVVWDGKNERGRVAASGIYIYQITTEKFTQARKMLFLK